MSELQRQADKVIHRLSRRRKTTACYPCAKRKIRCQGDYPCSACKTRGHPEICFPASERASPFPPTSAGSSGNSKSPAANPSRLIWDERATLPGESTEYNSSVDQGPIRTAVGGFSGATYVHDALLSHDGLDLRDVRAGLGLTNATILRTRDGGELNSALSSPRLANLYPSRPEVLRFLQPFRTSVAPFYPIIASMDELEMSVHKLLDDLDTNEPDSSVAKCAARTALYLAVLAVGAQFSDLPTNNRHRHSQSLIERCDACLCLARYTAKPSPRIVQTLLLVGLHAQNAGRSDEAWALLGLTFRLAQALQLDGQSGREEHFLWRSVLWQDSLLSLRYDRYPLYGNRLPPARPNIDNERDLDYFSCMHRVCTITRLYLLCDTQQRRNATKIHDHVASLVEIEQRSISFLKSVDQCASLEQKMQHHALQMHISFLVSEMCRPFLLPPTLNLEASQTTYRELHDVGISTLQSIVHSFLSLSRISSLPCRSWSLTHEVFTAVCVLTLLNHRRTSERTDALLSKFQLLLEREVASESDNGTSPYSMMQRGERLLNLLEKSTTSSRPRENDHSADVPNTIPLPPPTPSSLQTTTKHAQTIDEFQDGVLRDNTEGDFLSQFSPSFDEFLNETTNLFGVGDYAQNPDNDLWYNYQ